MVKILTEEARCCQETPKSFIRTEPVDQLQVGPTPATSPLFFFFFFFLFHPFLNCIIYYQMQDSEFTRTELLLLYQISVLVPVSTDVIMDRFKEKVIAE
jgi:hypothetical protein